VPVVVEATGAWPQVAQPDCVCRQPTTATASNAPPMIQLRTNLHIVCPFPINRTIWRRGAKEHTQRSAAAACTAGNSYIVFSGDGLRREIRGGEHFFASQPGSTGSLSSANTPKTHSWTRRSGSCPRSAPAFDPQREFTKGQRAFLTEAALPQAREVDAGRVVGDSRARRDSDSRRCSVEIIEITSF
jgi:hypothetical protein